MPAWVGLAVTAGPSARRARLAVGGVVPAAGIGSRLGDQGPKALVEAAGRPLLAWALDDLEAAACVRSIVVVTHADALEAVAKLVAGEGFAKVCAVVAGGATRQASVAAGLAELPAGPTHVAVHDGARPLAGPGLLDELVDHLLAARGALAGVVPGLPVADTIRRVEPPPSALLPSAPLSLAPPSSAGAPPTPSGVAARSLGVVDRTGLRAIQTPQLFLRELLEEAHRRAALDRFEATDEAALVERLGYPVAVVPGRLENIKVTTPFDLAVAGQLLARRGLGNPRGVPRSEGGGP